MIDVSGTMNPKQQGKFKEMKECVCQLLEPEGEGREGVGRFKR